MTKTTLILLSICLGLPLLTLAEEKNSDKCCGVVISGYLDGSYNYLERSNRFISNDFNRVFDLEEHGFTLQQAALTVAQQPAQGWGGLVNVLFGRDALTTASFGYNPDIGIGQNGFDILQVYGQFAHGSFTIMMGKFVTLVGVEVVDPTADTNFSRGLLFANTPDTHTGVRGIYAWSDKLKFTLGFNDGWDNIRDLSRGVTTEWGIAYTPNTTLSLSAQGYSGEERVFPRTATGPKGWRNLIDLIATYNFNDNLSLSLNYDYGTQSRAFLATQNNTDDAIWQGIAAYFNYKLSNTWRLSLRGEDFEDRNGYRTGVAQTLKEITLTIAYMPIKSIELRAETRHDFSNVASFLDRNGIDASKNQQSYAIEGIYKFNNS